MKIKIDFKSKKTWIIIGAVALAIILALGLTITIINSNKSKQNGNKIIVNPIIADYEAIIKATDEKLASVNGELAKVSVTRVKDNLTKYNVFGLDDYFSTMGVDTLEADIFNFVNQDIYLVKIIPISDLVTNQTFYYKDNEFTALDIESSGSGAITRYYIYKEKVIAEKALISTEPSKNGTVKLYVSPLIFENQAKMLAVAADDYNYSKDTSIQTEGEALDIAKKGVLYQADIISFDKMQMIANKEYYIFKEESSKAIVIAYICIEKETGIAKYKEASDKTNTLYTKEQWLERNETIALKIYYPNKDATKTVATDYIINKAKYNKDISGELVKIINQELGLGINKLTIEAGKAIVDISTLASQTKFDNGSAGAAMAIESLTKTIFNNTTATTLKVTVDGQGKVVGNHFTFVEDFVK